MAKVGRPKKAIRRTEYLELRLTVSEKEAFEKAAEIAGASLSAWARERLRRSSIRELEESGLLAPFLQSVL